MSIAKMDSLKTTLENDGEFCRAYLASKIRDTTADTLGKSVDVQRREIINTYIRQRTSWSTTMRERIELQQYFDERWNLCPYGLRNPAETPSQPENQEMTIQNTNAPTIETKTFIGGIDAAQLSDEQIFKKIREIETEVADLKKTEHKPKKLEAKIAQMEKAILDLVAYVDERDAK